MVENITGAGGSTGVGHVARAAPDGYTIGIGNWGSNVANGALYTLPYDLLTDFEPVSMLPSEPNLILARSSITASNLQDLIAWLERMRSRRPAAPAASADRRMSPASCFNSKQECIFSWCRIAAPARRFKTWSAVRSTP